MVSDIATVREALTASIAQMRIWICTNGDMVGAIQENIDNCNAALAALDRIEEGWQLVPKEPTDEMLEAGWEKEQEGREWGRVSSVAADIYEAMLAAAPPPPAEEEET